MGVAILSKKIHSKFETISSIWNAGFNIGARVDMNANSNLEKRTELHVMKEYEGYDTDSPWGSDISFDIVPEKGNIIENHWHIHINGLRYFMVAGVADPHYNRLDFDFFYSYLKLEPEKLILFDERSIITLEIMKKIDESNSFRNNWWYDYVCKTENKVINKVSILDIQCESVCS